MTQDANFQVEIQQSSKSLVQLDEPQVHYLLLDIRPGKQIPVVHPPVYLAIVFDCSTSMMGPRLDQMRSVVMAILKAMQPEDRASVVVFSDRAEVILTPDQARVASVADARLQRVKPRGGTEISQGLTAGMDEIHRYYSQEGVNHIILLTDGRTYGDEDLCMGIASEAAEQGIAINSIGIGSDWSDRLLNDLAIKTGGQVTFLSARKAVTDILHTIHQGIVMRHVQVNGSLGEHIDLRSALQLQPEPVKLDNRFPVTLGHLPYDGTLQLLLELVIRPNIEEVELTLVHLNVSGDLPGQESEVLSVSIDIILPIANEPDPNLSPDDFTSARNINSFNRAVKKARREAELGQDTKAVFRLFNLASQLITSGEFDLAKATLNEAIHLSQPRIRETEKKQRFWESDERRLAKLMIMRRKVPDWLRPLMGLDLVLSGGDIDRLTGYFEKMSDASQSASLALIEIDKFEEFIERYGRNPGERMLENLKSLLRREFGEGAVLGESLFDGLFVAYKSNSLGGAKIQADLIRTRARTFATPDSERKSISPISITIGLAFYPDHGSTIEALFQAANFALLVGKSRGGDCVVPP